MHLDIEDLLAGAIGTLIGRFLLFVVAVWIGCGIGLVACNGSDILRGHSNYIGEIPWMMLYSPFRLFSMWGFLNFPFLLIALFYFMMKEEAGKLEWGIIVGVESLAVMAGWVGHYNAGWIDLGLAWLCWILLLGPFEAGLWFLKQMAHNQWAREVTALNAENHYRIAEQETIERLRVEREKLHDQQGS